MQFIFGRRAWGVNGWAGQAPWLCLAVLTLVFGGVAHAQTGGEPADAGAKKTVRVLAVGNSFSGNALAHLRPIVEAAGHEIIIGHASIGGGRLQQHWEKVAAFQQDPQSEAARYKSGKTLHELLVAEPWDYVTLQQYSWLSHDTGTHEPWASQLRDYIREHAPTADFLVHQIWAYRVDDPRFNPEKPDYGKPEGGPKTQQEMYERITAAYDELAERMEARVIPVGDAFYLADTDPRHGFVPAPVDPSAFEEPNRPEEPHSLHTGWVWRKQKDGSMKLGYDGHHAGLAGQYLAGCVWFEVLFDESVVGNGFVPEGLDPAYATYLQEVAHEAVQRREAAAPAAPAGMQ